MADLIEEKSIISMGDDKPEMVLRKVLEEWKKNGIGVALVEYSDKDYGKKHKLIEMIDSGRFADIYEEASKLATDKDGRVKKMHRLKIKRKGVLND